LFSNGDRDRGKEGRQRKDADHFERKDENKGEVLIIGGKWSSDLGVMLGQGGTKRLSGSDVNVEGNER